MNPKDLQARTEPFTGWEVPPGFETYDLVQHLTGPILGKDGVVVEYGDRIYRWGVAHVYDHDGERVIVRPGSRQSYGCVGSYYMEIESLAGCPGQQFSNVHAALAEARAYIRETKAAVR